MDTENHREVNLESFLRLQPLRLLFSFIREGKIPPLDRS